MSGECVLTRRELNRALLARQLLLERQPVTVVKAVERLGGLQAQSTPSPYLSLWTRLERLDREELTKALASRRLVKALLQRGTLHIVTPGDYWAFSTARRELGDVAPSRIVTTNGIVHATILVDGFVAGTWQLENGRVVLEPFGKLSVETRRELKAEAEQLEAFVD